MALVDRLDAGRLRGALGEVMIGREIIVLNETTSTNDYVWELAQEGAREGVVVFAEHQTAGRGQRDNTWESAAGQGLWFSVLLQPEIDIKESANITTWAARTISATIENTIPVRPTIKFPNDVFVDERKVAGVLVEMRARAKMPHLAILGIGVNVHHSARDFSSALRHRATSLALLGQGRIDRNMFAAALLRNLDRTYSRQFGIEPGVSSGPANPAESARTSG